MRRKRQRIGQKPSIKIILFFKRNSFSNRFAFSNMFTFLSQLHWQEIDKVNSLTLGEIIRLNTEFKSAPDGVFFSTDYCSGVKDFQCVPKTDSTTVTEASSSNATRNALIAISVVMFVAIVIIAAVLAYFRFRSKPNKTKVISIKEAEPK